MLQAGFFRAYLHDNRDDFLVPLVKNIFQRNFPEIHFDADIRPVTWEQVQEEIKRLKIKLQTTIEKMDRLSDLYREAYDRVRFDDGRNVGRAEVWMAAGLVEIEAAVAHV